jgi:5-methylcytosine-specific restriction endonuclease McrA
MTKWTKEYRKEYQKKYWEIYKLKFTKLKDDNRNCLLCEKKFVPLHNYQKICSQKECRKKAKKVAKKKYEKKAKERDPVIAIGDNIKDSARNRNIEAPHKPIEYSNWYREQTKLCCYCGNTNDTIKKYLEKIGEKITWQQNRLGFDRLDSSKGYLLDNLTLACSICNTHKSDIISHKDFKEIALKYITPKIKKTLNDF